MEAYVTKITVFYSAPEAVVRFRYLFHRVFHFWLYLLNCWASKYVSRIDRPCLEKWTGREKFRRRNRQLQEELNQIFLPFYQACHACGSYCCKHPHRPFFAVDFLLCGGTLGGEIHLARWNLRHILKWVAKLVKAAYEPQSEAPMGMPCPELKETGCRLPWGERSAVCVIHLCKNFARLMSWREYGRYLWLTTKYEFHLTLSLLELLSECK